MTKDLNRVIKGLKVVNGQMVTTVFSTYSEYRFHFLMYIHHCSQDWLFTFTFDNSLICLESLQAKVTLH